MALFCATGGYALQHFSYIFASFASAWLRAETWKVLSAFVYVGIFAALYAAGYLFFASCMKRAKDVLSREKAVIFFSAGVLLCVIVFSALCDTSDFGGLYSAFFACRGFEAMCCLLSLGLMRLLFRGKQAESEMREMRILWEKEKQQYRMTRDRVDLINIKCHDIKKYIAQLRERPSDISERELGELESLVSVYDRSVKTGNEAIDVVLADKSLSCERAGVRLSCMLDGKLFSFMSSSDAYSLFGNLLDNAISAAEAVSDPEKRVISLTCRRSAGLLFLHEENYYEGELRRDGERFLSTTGDDDFHGFGTKSIVWTARKYGGEAQFSAEGGIFSLDVVLPQPKET